jgi:hypothetical protein
MKFSIGQSGNPGGRPKVLGEVLRFLKPHVRAAGTNFPTSGSSSQKNRLIEPLVNTKNCCISRAQNLRPRPIFQCQKTANPLRRLPPPRAVWPLPALPPLPRSALLERFAQGMGAATSQHRGKGMGRQPAGRSQAA